MCVQCSESSRVSAVRGLARFRQLHSAWQQNGIPQSERAILSSVGTALGGCGILTFVVWFVFLMVVLAINLSKNTTNQQSVQQYSAIVSSYTMASLATNSLTSRTITRLTSNTTTRLTTKTRHALNINFPINSVQCFC